MQPNLNTKTEYTIYSPEQLSKMTNRVQRRIFLDFLYGNFKDGTINMPYVCEEGHMCRGSKEKGLYRNFGVNELDLADSKIYDCTDSYTSVNVFKTGAESNARINVKYINDIFIDLDVCHNNKQATKTEIENKKNQLFENIRKAIENKKIPKPSAIVDSGRGFHLHYKLKNPIDTDNNGEVDLFNAVYDNIFVKFVEALGEEFLQSIDSDVDTSVKNCDRICRIPGTKNKKAGSICRLIFMAAPYDFEDIIKAFGIKKNALILRCQNTGKSKEKKKNSTAKTVKTKPAKINRVATKNSSSNITSVQNITVNPVSTKIVKDTSKSVLNILKAMLSVRKWVEGDHRERYIFLWYTTLKILHGSDFATTEIIKYNKKFGEPLPESKLLNVKNNVDNHIENMPFFKAGHGDGIFSFKPETVIGKDWLDLTADEIKIIGYVPHSQKKSKSRENQILSRKRDEKIAALYLDGDGYKIIAKKFKGTDIECSPITVKNTVERLGIKGRFCSLSDVNFGANARFSRTVERVKPLTKLLSSSLSSAAVLDDNFADIEKCFRKGNNMLIEGEGGTGKSSILQKLRALKADGTTLTICPSNTAASRVDGVTFEKAFQLSVTEGYRYKSNELPIINRFVWDKYKTLETVFVDEISMFRIDKFKYMLNIIKSIEHTFNIKIQLVLLGDLFQLAPVITFDEKAEFQSIYGMYNHGYIIEDRALMQGLDLHPFVLKKNYRAKEDEFFAAFLSKLRYADMSVLSVLKSRRDDLMQYAEDGSNLVHIVPTQYLQDKINSMIIANHLTDKTFKVFEAKNYTMFSKCKKYISVFKGMPVIFTKNINSKCTKGTFGVVEEVFSDSVKISVESNGKIFYFVVRQICDRYGMSDSESTLQLPIEPAFAITVHKSQSLTLKKVVIHSGMFTEGQLYVAASRVRHLKDIYVVGKLHPNELMCNQTVKQFELEKVA